MENASFQLVHAASILCTPNPDHTVEVDSEAPFGWDKELFEKMINKDYRSRLIIAGALIAAELDRINMEEYTDGMRKAEEDTIID